MPQLNTSNWFLTFMWTWLVLLALTAKTTKTKLTMKPKKLEKKMNYAQWTWPW
uniref:ATP synthase complex subunit 8 n=1 Tax=Phrynocephalus versicolor TaxID=171651 RepID=A0A0U1WNL5_PHRVE|nr:ATP synthase F0 subunit 8 [Phrynocephalus versicolor]AIG23751.1 ATP synthase F0 subunit 8 [Phrynocephalus versicolor]